MKILNSLRLPAIFLFFVLFSCKITAQTPADSLGYPAVFTPHGPGGGGFMYSPSINWHNHDEIFLNCDMGGVYRSLDGGRNWQMQHRDNLISLVKGKMQFTSDPNVIYVVRRSVTNQNDPLFRGELAKSTDGGATWQPMPDPTDTGVHALEVDPGSTQRMVLNEYNRLFFSDNGGASWTEVYHPADDQLWLSGAFWDGDNIYVGTGKGLLASHDGGLSFSLEIHDGLASSEQIFQFSGAKSGNITRFFIVTTQDKELYAWDEVIAARPYLKGVYKMDYSANAAWADTRSNVQDQSIALNWVDLAKNNIQQVWMAGEQGGLPMVFRSNDGGQTWVNTFRANENQNISTGWGGDYGAFSYLWSGAALGFDVDDANPNRVITTDGYGHITEDGGLTWRATYVQPAYQNPIWSHTSATKYYRSSGLDVTTAHQIFWLDDQKLFACNTDIGGTYSEDGGETWSFGHSTYYPWGTVANPNWYRMVQRPDNQVLYAALSEYNDVYLGYRIADSDVEGQGIVVTSDNQGSSWDTLYNFGKTLAWLEMDKNNPNRLYASVVDHLSGGIYRSDDAGLSWAQLPAPPRTLGHPYNIVSLNDGGLVATYCARAEDDRVTLTESSGVFFSNDGGNTWSDRTDPAMKMYTKDIVVDPHDPDQNTWYATVWGRFTVWPGPNNAGNGGLYRTTDRGLTWTRIWANELAESITLHPEKPGTAYLTSENNGLFFTQNLNDPQPDVERVASFPFWRPKRVFFKPNKPNEVWVTTMGGGLWMGKTMDVVSSVDNDLVASTVAMTVFPNPIAQGQQVVFVDLQGADKQEFILRLTDFSGKEIMRKNATGGKMPMPCALPPIPAGLYFLEIWENGKLQAASKLLRL